MLQTLATLVTVAFLLFTPAQAATIFKCKDTHGALLYQEKPCAEETKSISSWNISTDAKMDDDGSPSSTGPLVIGQGNNGHYFIDGAINDNFLNFVIDTGATTVALPGNISTAAGLRCIKKGMSNTANGLTSVCTTIIQKLRFGNFTLRDVEAVIIPSLNQPLLGMNVLKRFKVEQDNGQMRLSKKY